MLSEQKSITRKCFDKFINLSSIKITGNVFFNQITLGDFLKKY